MYSKEGVMMMIRNLKCKSILVSLALILQLSACGQKETYVFNDFSEDDEEIQENKGMIKPENNKEGQIVRKQEEFIYVHVCGEVNFPGVYKLLPNSRGMDAVKAAGGLTEEALDYAVNLAVVLKDGDKLYIPGITEQNEKSSLININTASVEELCSLPGVGASRAGDIVSDREKNGLYKEKEDIMRVSGIKDSLFQKICDLITVGE